MVNWSAKTSIRNYFHSLQKHQVGLAMTIAASVLLSACQTTDPMDAPYDTLSKATSANTPEVAVAMQQLQANPDSKVNLAALIYRGASTDVILKVMNHYGSYTRFWDGEQINTLNHWGNTPYSEGNAFQLAIAAGRPGVAKRWLLK